MTKLGIARVVGECSLAGGCIGGGVTANQYSTKAYQKHKEAEKSSKDAINVQSERMFEVGLKEGINCLKDNSTDKGACAQRMNSKKTQAQQWSTTSTKYRDGYAELYKCLTQGTDTKNSCLTRGENKLK